MSTPNREWIITDFAGIEGLQLRDYVPQNPGPGEVRLRTEALVLNWGDMDLMQGRFSFNFSQLPARVGREAVGIVDQIGDGVTGILGHGTALCPISTTCGVPKAGPGVNILILVTAAASTIPASSCTTRRQMRPG